MMASAPADIDHLWWRKRLVGVPGFTGTIRGRIVIAFLVMSLITGALGSYTAVGMNRASALVARTFDHSLMSINYARAAAADFASMRALFVRRWMTSDPAVREQLDRAVEALEQTLAEDLTIATERASSGRAASAATKVWTAVAAWNEVRLGLDESLGPSAAWEALDKYARQVDEDTDLLVNYMAGDGFTYRKYALEAVERDIKLTFIGTALALFLSGLVAYLLVHRIVGPVAAASIVAGSIAEGKLDFPIPPGAGDELGDLLRAMGAMRSNIREMMEREVALRRSAQARLADALESSREGVVVVDRIGQVVLANSRASEFMSIAPDLLRSELASLSGLPASELEPRPVKEPGIVHEANEVCLPDGRWLRVSLSITQDGGFVAVFGDITMLKTQKESLRATNLRLDAALDNMSQGLCMYDDQDCLKVVNRRFCEIFQIPLAQVRPGMPFRDVLAISPVSDDLGGHGSLSARGAERTELLDLSEGRVVAATYQPLADGGWLATYEDVTERLRAEERISFMARHDALTGLPNRNLLQERLESAAAQIDRDRGFALLCLDLDNFKQINDTLGHTLGDELLRSVAQRLQSCLREADTVARLGGDEFAIVQPGVSGPELAAKLAERIIKALSAPYDLLGHRALLGVSCGIALAPQDGKTGDKLLKNADLALYRAKAGGRATFRFYEPEMDNRLQARRALELDLREALERDEFELFYQPIYELGLGRVSGFEALLRWRRPDGNLTSPAEFIPIAEEIGLIIPIGEWALRQAMAEAAKWPEEIKIAVNVSAVQFRSGLVQIVRDALHDTGLAADRLELEITESVLLTRGASTLSILHEVRALGVRIAMDDFGTGYSSLSYLRSFPFDKIKIDRSFVRDLSEPEQTGVIVRAIISLANSLGMLTTAEGVENEEQLSRLRIEGCDQVQGFLFSPPVPAEEVSNLLIRSLRMIAGMADLGRPRSSVTIRGRKAQLRR